MIDMGLRRDAIMIMVAERPFVRWSELSGREQEHYERKARRIRQHLKDYEPSTRGVSV